MSIVGLMLRGVALLLWLGLADAAPGVFPRTSLPLSKRSSHLVGCNKDQEKKIETALADMANLGVHGHSEASKSNIGYAYFIFETIDCCNNSYILGTHITSWIPSLTFSKSP